MKEYGPFKDVFDTSSRAWKVYYDLISSLYWEPRPTGRTDIQVHHIMPRCCYRHGLVEGNNMESEYNKLYVTEMMHVVLHYCLFLCAKDKRLKKWMGWGWRELNKNVGLSIKQLNYITS